MKTDYLWFLYQIGVEHTIRLNLYLDEVDRSCSEDEEALLVFFRKQVIDICEFLTVGIKDLTELSSDNDVVKDQADLDFHVRRHRQAVLKLADLHFALTYLPTRPSISPEVYAFLGESFPNFFDEVAPMVVYFPDYNFEETNIQKQEVPVILRIPQIEFRNPLMWANLIHEMGHALDNKRKLTDGFSERHPVNLTQNERGPEWTKKSTDWVSELYADQIGIAVAGPAYLLAFVTWYLSSRYLAPGNQALQTDSHPLPSRRVSAMEEYLKQNDLLTDGVKLGLEIFKAVKTVFTEPNSATFRPFGVSEDDVVGEARSSVNTELSGHLARFSGTNTKIVDILVKMLNGKTTIPSRFSETPEQIAKEFESVSGRGFRDRNECFKVAQVLREEPNHSAEIVNAGWEYKLTKGRKEFREIFSDTQRKFSSRFKAYERCLNNLETRLRKSVETSRMHKRWQEEMRKVELDPSDQLPIENAVTDDEAKSAGSRNNPSLLNEKQILERLCPRHPARIIVTPILDIKQQLQPSSLDLRLGTEFALIRSSGLEFLDILQEEDPAKREIAKYIEVIHLLEDGEFALHPGEFALGCTLEFIVLPADIAGRLVLSCLSKRIYV